MSDTRADELPQSVSTFTIGLAGLTGFAVLAGWRSRSVTPAAWALAYVPLVVVAEYLVIRVRLRSRRDINALNLVEAVLAPLILSFSTPVAVLVVMAAQGVAAVRRNDAVRGLFNTAQWGLAAAMGSLTFNLLGHGRSFNAQNALALLIGLAVVGAVNHSAFAVVVTLAQRQPLQRVPSALGEIPWSGWAVGWLVNTSFGLLFASSLQAGPGAVGLFVVPLLALHVAHRQHARATAGRSRLERIHAASQALSRPVDPAAAIPQFLAAVARCYSTEAVDFVLVDATERVLYRHRDETSVRLAFDADHERLLGALLIRARTVRLAKGVGVDLDPLRVAEGWLEVVAAPLLRGDELLGLLCVYNPTGREGDARDELAILDSLAREAAATIDKGRTVQRTLEERALLASLVANASDGIVTVATDGVIRSWNPGLARITGWSEEEMVGQRALDALQPAAAGQPVDLERWTLSDHRPTELEITARDGRVVSLECSYGLIPAGDTDGGALVVVARDVTGAREVARLQQEVGRLTELEAAQRGFVNQLQDAVRPDRPDVPGAQLAVEYLPSDPSAPSGGDLYDWQILPDGDVHLAVVDVLGHGVGATKSAVTVTHVLRILALEGCPLAQLMARAESVLAAHGGDLVATALVARYRPTTGALTLAGAGHPPALIIRSGGLVEQVAAPGIPFGWPGAGSETIVETVLAERDTLVLYTDGLIEATRDIIAGMKALVTAASEMRGLPVSDLVRQLVARSLAGSERRDDSLALVLRRAASSLSRDEFRHVVPADSAAIATLRHELANWLSGMGRPPESIDALVLVASELASNAVLAGATRTSVRARVENGIEILEVEDDGPGYMAGGQPALPADGLADRGRGLFICRAVVDDLDVRSSEKGTIVTARRRFARTAEPA